MSKKDFVSCTIKQLDVNTGDTLTDMQAFASILRLIQSMCIDNDAEHLAIIGSESYRLSSNLLEHAGFTLCDCEYPSQVVSVGIQRQLCMLLPTRPTRSSVYEDQGHHPMDSSSTRKGDHAIALAKGTPTAQITNTNGPSAMQSLIHKEYCMFWIFRGECGYMQKGCCYKHEIPLDKETRKRIGLRSIPPWFKQSPYWGPWLQQLNPAERPGMISNGHENAAFPGQLSGGPSEPRPQDFNARGRGKATTEPRGRGSFGPHMLDTLP